MVGDLVAPGDGNVLERAPRTGNLHSGECRYHAIFCVDVEIFRAWALPVFSSAPVALQRERCTGCTTGATKSCMSRVAHPRSAKQNGEPPCDIFGLVSLWLCVNANFGMSHNRSMWSTRHSVIELWGVLFLCTTSFPKVSRENGQCISGSADGSCIVWDLHRGVRILALFEPNVFKGVRYHPDESQYITCGSNHKVRVAGYCL